MTATSGSPGSTAPGGAASRKPPVITLTAPAITAPNTDDLYFAYGSADF
ncbi:hypothetical protein NCG97_00545 [Streptomyces lydicamycinicus]|nr:hypothetical protein [Streptomyces lydicamycinicus]URZ99501.1 hypothetical protein NCG97_00545 [Streptomyces lydicamycinicus]